MNFPIASVRDTLRTVYRQVDTLRGEFAEGVALGVQEDRLSNVAWMHVPCYRNNAELVCAATQNANMLLCTI